MKKFLYNLLILSIAFTFLGCSNKTNTEDSPEEIISESVNDNHLEKEETTKINVSNVEELIDAISPNTTINVEPGYYNLTEYIDNIWTEQEENWNNAHPYVRIRKCFDGVELLVQSVDNLTINGNVENLADAQIMIEPRYAGVLNFLNCNNLNISYLTIGHTETGECTGNVLNLYGCKNVNINNCDLYGCGSYGILADNGTGNMFVNNTIIRDCSSGALALNDCTEKLEFRNCILMNSADGGYYFDNKKSELSFYSCEFDIEESKTWKTYENVKIENCNWIDIADDYQYPDWK